MTNLSLSKIAISDIPTLQDISKQTFIEAFAAVDTEANMTKYLEEALSIQRLTDEFMTEGSEFYFVKKRRRNCRVFEVEFWGITDRTYGREKYGDRTHLCA